MNLWERLLSLLGLSSTPRGAEAAVSGDSCRRNSRWQQAPRGCYANAASASGGLPRGGATRRPPRLAAAGGRRYFALDEKLQTALVDLADREGRPAEEIQVELLTAGLAHLQTSERLKECWGTLSQREQEVTAYTCLGYTNRQMAARMGVSPDTVKGYVRQALVKFDLHSKDELRMLLGNWDFSEWGPPAQC